MTPIVQILPSDLVLQKGSHKSPEHGMCVMEAVAFVAGVEHSDQPACACPVMGAFLRSWNDAIPDAGRRTELLAPLIPKLVDSRSTASVEQRRADLAFDWCVRVYAPAWMDLNEVTRPSAAELRALVPLTAASTVTAAQPVIAQAQSAAAMAAAMAAAWAAAGAAASKVLAPTVAVLQVSALELIDHMLAVTPDMTDEAFNALCDWTPLTRGA